MLLAIRSELRKFFTTRLWWGMAIGVAVSAVAFALLTSLTAGLEVSPGVKTPGLDDPAVVRGVYSSGLSVAYLMTLAVGVMMIGAEYRHKTITGTFLARPRRAVVMAAKVAALLVIGAFYGVISMGTSVIPGASVIAAKGYSAFPDASVWRTVALGLLVLGLWALIGLGIGILIPNQVAALLISIGVAWIVEPLLAQLVLPLWEWGRTAAQYFPSAATQATMAVSAQSGFDPTQSLKMLPWWGGATVLAGYAAVMAIIGTLLTLRRDVT